MYVRLAFAVAAHLEPEILLVDEVLAVGDVAFQKKCLGKMGEVAKGGRTVLFVSHNMGAIEELCNRAFLLDEGRAILSGETHKVISFYLAKNYKQNVNPLSNSKRTGNGKIRVVSFYLESPDGEVLQVARSGASVVFAFKFDNQGCGPKDRISFGFSVHTDREFGLFHYYSHFSNIYFENIPSRGYFKCFIPELTLSPGNYLVMCRVVMNGDHITGEEVDWPRAFLPITVVGGDFFKTGNVNLSIGCPILVKGIWSIDNVKAKN
jgi:lipopolysaccharide transport system ATP-binding protein